MLTVDEIRREMEKTGELAPRKTRGSNDGEGEKMSNQKGLRPIPEKLNVVWVSRARKVEIQKVLADKFGVSAEDLPSNLISARKMILEKIPRKRRKVSIKAPRKAMEILIPREKPPEPSAPRLVLAHTFPCPACGAHLMIEKGGDG